jgi:hypothetical protein
LDLPGISVEVVSVEGYAGGELNAHECEAFGSEAVCGTVEVEMLVSEISLGTLESVARQIVVITYSKVLHVAHFTRSKAVNS